MFSEVHCHAPRVLYSCMHLQHIHVHVQFCMNVWCVHVLMCTGPSVCRINRMWLLHSWWVYSSWSMYTGVFQDWRGSRVWKTPLMVRTIWHVLHVTNTDSTELCCGSKGCCPKYMYNILLISKSLRPCRTVKRQTLTRMRCFSNFVSHFAVA